MSTINPAGRADGTTSLSENDRPISSGGVKAVGASQVKTPGIDDGWDSASSTSWATDLAEPNDEARRQAWRDHDDHLERTIMQREQAREEGESEASGERESLSAEELAGETAPLKGPLHEAQNKLGLRSLRQADTALHHNLRSSQNTVTTGVADRVAGVSPGTQPGTDEQSRHRQREPRL